MTNTKNDKAALEAGCYFDITHAHRVRDFFRKYLRHSKGQYAGKKFDIVDWQWEDIVKPLFGWRRKNGTRRYRKAYIEVSKKNGKSTLCSGLSLYFLCGDGEPGAEVYTAAGDRKQASIIFDEASNMVESSPALSKRIIQRRSLKSMGFPQTQSSYHALSSDVATKEGLNIHALLFDELHTQPNRKLWDTLRYGGIARRQPMLITITTAGDDVTSLCYEEHCYAERLLDEDDPTIDIEQLSYIRAATETDDVLDPETHKKANPGYGELINPDEIMSAANKALQQPSEFASFMRYRLNVWMSGGSSWIPGLLWDACANLHVAPPASSDKCYIGVDLSSVTDLTAVARYFPASKELMCEFWCPEKSINERKLSKKMRYDYFVENGQIVACSGGAISYGMVESRIAAMLDEYDVVEIGFDPWNAINTAQNIQNLGAKVSFVRQGFASLSPPMKEMERLVISQELVHRGNPVLRWMNGNVKVVRDINANLMPSKKTSKDSIDGISASLIALHLHIRNVKPTSVYLRRGLITS